MPEVKTPEEGAQYQGLWVFIEHHEGELANVSRELLGKGRELADQRKVPLTGVLLGHNVDDLAKIADPKTQAARIGRTVGGKKRKEIEAKAAERSIRVLNPLRRT